MEDDLRSGLFEPWVLLPTQVAADAQTGRTLSGPGALMLAVLEEAIRCIERGRRYRHAHIRKIGAEAEAWMRSDSREWPFAFASICDVLGLDVDATRARLLIDDLTGRTQPRAPVRRIGCGAGRTSCAPRPTSRAA
jgi:hypothetical protein